MQEREGSFEKMVAQTLSIIKAYMSQKHGNISFMESGYDLYIWRRDQIDEEERLKQAKRERESNTECMIDGESERVLRRFVGHFSLKTSIRFELGHYRRRSRRPRKV